MTKKEVSESKPPQDDHLKDYMNLATIVESAEDAIIGKTLEGTIVSWNKGAERIYGYTAKEIIDKSISILASPGRPDEIPEILKKIKNGEYVDHYETKRTRKDGKIIDISLTVSPIKDIFGKIVGASSIARDITGRTQGVRYARSLIEASLDPLVTISPDGKITDVNEATIKVTGVSREKIIGSDFSMYFTEPEKARQGYEQVFRIGSVNDYPLTIKNREGVLIEVLYNATVYKDDAGNVLGVFAAARDVTAQKQASQYTRSLIEASLDPLVTISPQGKIMDVNETTVKATGLSRQELIGTDFSDYFTEPEKAKDGYQQVLKVGFVTDYPLTIRHKDGKLIDVLYNAAVYKDVRGQVLGVFAAARDVTQTKQSSQYARSLIEASLDPLVTISPDGKITDVNEGSIKATGLPREKLIGTDFTTYFTEPDKARAGYMQVFEKGFVTDYPLTIKHKDGKEIDVLYNASVYKDPNGKVLGVFAAARDVTERRQLEKKLEEYAKGLETKVTERTKELEEKLVELERFQKLTVGRELKMMELKKDIERLTKEQGTKNPTTL
ncbi:MAG: PAS domain S-box protein [bacterium]|nr:PAS domain S-box protein [bacterium]